MRAITKNTRRVTALTLAAALVVAVYLNWQYARTGIGVDEEAVNVSAVAVEGEPVAAPVTDGLMTEAEAVSSANKNYGEAQLVSVANDAGAKFFEEARLKRQKAHDEAMDTIQKTLKTSGLSAEEKKDYTQQLTSNLEDLNAENEIETLVKAKGFADCLCFLQSGRADLTVMTSGDALTAGTVTPSPLLGRIVIVVPDATLPAPGPCCTIVPADSTPSTASPTVTENPAACSAWVAWSTVMPRTDGRSAS